MSSLAQSGNFAQSVFQRINTDESFTCTRSYSDLLIWTGLCAPLSNSDVFSLLPKTLNMVWQNEEIALKLMKRGALKPERLHAQGLAAHIVSFRRMQRQDSEIDNLKQQLAQLSKQFNALSDTVYDVVERLNSLEEENQTLKHDLSTHHFIPPSEKDTITRYAL